jgi:hypothetical protein
MMPAPENLTQTIPTPRNSQERLELANLLYREFQNRCFWHSPRDLIITEDLIPFVVKGLRTYGGHRGFKLAAKLQSSQATSLSPDREDLECH